MGPLEGVRVLDLATARGELAGRVLADLGAEVIKIEPPEGAEARRLPPFVDGRDRDLESSLFWAAVARGKQSVTLDLATSAMVSSHRGIPGWWSRQSRRMGRTDLLPARLLRISRSKPQVGCSGYRGMAIVRRFR